MKGTAVRAIELSCLLILVIMLAASYAARAENLLVNGGFESGNTGFSTEYIFADQVLDPQTYCIGSNPHDHHYAFYNMGAEEGLLMMIANGAVVPDVIVWRESGIPVTTNTDYYFSAWVASVTPEGPPTLLFSINGAQLGTVAPLPMGTWIEFYARWNSGSSTSADVTVVDLSTEFSGNDFVMDNMVLAVEPPVPVERTAWGKIKGLYR